MGKRTIKYYVVFFRKPGTEWAAEAPTLDGEEAQELAEQAKSIGMQVVMKTIRVAVPEVPRD